MTIQEIKEKFIQHPSYFKKGNIFLAKKFNTTPEIIQSIRNAKNGLGVKESKSNDKGGTTHTIVSNKSLSPEEIGKLAQVDNITTFVTNYWLKSQVSDVWTYSVQVKQTINNFYTEEQLSDKLKEMIPNLKAKTLPKVSSNSKYNCAIIYVSDIHAGAQNTNNIHGISYTKNDLKDRLNSILTHITETGVKYQVLTVVNLGDSLDSQPNGQTTRGGHNLGSLSTKDQFDIYFEALSEFYLSLFNSGISDYYSIINILNDNHTGVGLSYMANKAIEAFLSFQYPDVEFVQQEEFIKTYYIGNHQFAFSHGKDEKIMKFGWKKGIDDKMDSWFQQYFSSPDTWNHVRTGDLHLFDWCRGKFGDKMCIPSMYGTSDYISLQFGETRPGAVLEEVCETQELTRVTPIFF